MLRISHLYLPLSVACETINRNHRQQLARL